MEKINDKYFLAIALLKEVNFDFETLKKDLKKNWKIDATAEVVDNNLIFNIGDMIATIGFIDVALPEKETEAAALKNYRWPEGPSIIRSHKAHVIVSVMGEATSITKGKLLVKLMDACCCQENVISVYANGSMLRPEIYKALASMMHDGLVPFYNLVWLGVYTDANGGTSVYTNGLNLLGREEIEIVNSQKEPEKIHELLSHLCTYILDRNLILKDGETIDYIDGQKITVTYSDGVAIDKKSFKLGF